jgi:hypothetical protein
MRKFEEDIVRQMLGKEDRALSTAGWTQVETLAGKRPKVVMAAFGIGTTDTRDALKVVAAGRESLAELPDALKAVPAVCGGVLLIVLGAEVGEMAFKYRMELVAATGNVPVCRRGRDRDRRAHINIYGRNELPASDRVRGHRAPHNMAHPPDAFSELALLRGRR